MAFAAPILSVVCPPFMVCVVMVLFKKRMGTTWPIKGAALGAYVVGPLLTTIDDTYGVLPAIKALPFTDLGFSWLPFAIVGGIIGAVAFKAIKGNKESKAVA